MRLVNECLLAGQLAARNAGLDCGGIAMSSFLDSQRCHGFAAGEPGKPFGLLLVASAEQDCARRDGCGHQRTCGERFAEFLDHQAGRQETEI